MIGRDMCDIQVYRVDASPNQVLFITIFCIRKRYTLTCFGLPICYEANMSLRIVLSKQGGR